MSVTAWPWLRARNHVRHAIDRVAAPEVYRLQQRIFQIWREQEAEWDKPIYWAGWFYQSMPQIHLLGWRDTPGRIEIYGMDSMLSPTSRVLDIGGNCGFIPLTLAGRAAEWTIIEPNPYLCRIGRAVGEHLGATNVKFEACGFEEFLPAGQYDLICSFASHATYDGNTKLQVEDFFDRIDAMLAPGGHFAFESHNGEEDEPEAFEGVVREIGKRFAIEHRFSFKSPEYTLPSQRRTGVRRHFIRAAKAAT